MNQALRTHIENKKIRDGFLQAAKSLVDATNIMGCDDHIAEEISTTLQKHEAADLFFLLIKESTPDVLDKVSHTDGRSEATVKLLKEMNVNDNTLVLAKGVREGFAMGIASSHNTLIQSFYRAVKDAARRIYEKDVPKANEVTIEAYKSAMRETKSSLVELLTLLEELQLETGSGEEDTIKYFATKEIYLPFI